MVDDDRPGTGRLVEVSFDCLTVWVEQSPGWTNAIINFIITI